MALVLTGVLMGALLTANQALASNQQEVVALNADNEKFQLFNLISPDTGLVLKMSGPTELFGLSIPTPTPEAGDVWAEIRKGFSIPDLNSRLVRARERTLQKNTHLVNALLQRSEPYIYFIAQECAKRGLPSELALLPFVESEFNPHARSPASAVGLWQFIPSTGRHFELKQNKWVDERRDLVASTRAALDYLAYLVNLHGGNWHLALISYNWGEGSVLKAIKKAQKAGLPPTLANLDLPQETRHYIPRLQAMKNLIQSPEQFGMTLPAFPNKPYFEEIKRDTDLDLREVARLAGVELAVIRQLNAGLNQPFLYAAHSTSLLVPIEHAAKIQAGLAQHKSANLHRSYKVKKGDTLGEIAQQFDVSVKALAQLNGLGNGLGNSLGNGLDKERYLKPGMELSIPNSEEFGNWAS